MNQCRSASTRAGESTLIARRRRSGGFRTSRAGLLGIVSHSTARWRTPWSNTIVFRVEASPTPAACRSARNSSIRVGRRSRSRYAPRRGKMCASPERRVGPPCLLRQLGARVERPPPFDEFPERLLPCVEHRQRSDALPSRDLCVEQLGVGFAAKHLRALAAEIVAPSNPPDVATFSSD